jgi:exodeoxyribonuclease VII small subunit
MAARSEQRPPQMPLDSPDEGQSFEALFARLEAISEQLEQGGLSLESSVELYEEGMRIAQRCQEMLGDVEQRIETLRRRVVGNGEGAR